MSQLALNNGIALMDPDSGLAELYGKLYQIMHDANQVELPDYSVNPPLHEDGTIDQDAIRQQVLDDAEIMMKNSAFEWAKAISTTSGIGGGGSSGGGSFVSRNGDSMLGALAALYGFQGGHDGELILELIHDSALSADSVQGRVAHVTGHLRVDGDTSVDGKLSVGNEGIYFSNQQSIFYDDNKLNIASQDILMTGNVEVDGSFKLGNITLDGSGLFNGNMEYYYPGNCNNEYTDWEMRNAHVYGDLVVDGDQVMNGRLVVLKGFDLGESNQLLMYSVDPDNPVERTPAAAKNTCYVQLESDLNLWTDYAIKFDFKSILKVRGGSQPVVSLCAPGMILNLGDSDEGVATEAVRLQTDLDQYNGDFTIITKEGHGNFVGGLAAWTGPTGSEVLSTYFKSVDDFGVLFRKYVRFGSTDGPGIISPKKDELHFILPYLYTDTANNPVEETIPFRIFFAETDSLFKAQNNVWSASLNFDIGGAGQEKQVEFFSFCKPVESSSFSVKSTRYKTRLGENFLFFDDGIFMEGVFNDSGPDGIRHSGNSYFDGNVGTLRFASGFAGYGWAVIDNNKSFHATFDELTVRKKFRVYELEVSKQSVTNGSWWVTDSCSGDIVEPIN